MAPVHNPEHHSRHAPPRAVLDAEAAEWVARLACGPLSAAGHKALEDWQNRSPRHRQALEEARRTWDHLGTLPLTANDLGIDIASLPPARRWRLPALPRVLAGALAASVLALVWAGAVVYYGIDQPWNVITADHYTGPGEDRTITLEDGSTVFMGPATALNIEYSGDQRRVRLVSGQALFTAAPMGPDEPRPFVVAANHGTARALGTRFMVEHHDDAVEVTVIEHSVQVSSQNPAQAVALAPEQAVRYTDHAVEPAHPVNLANATAWQRGTLVFDRVPLNHVISELNRYRRGKIILANDELARHRVSGVFPANRPEEALDMITRTLDARITRLTSLVTVMY